MSQLDAAHDYIRRGWGIVPLHGWDPDTGHCRCPAGRFCQEKSRGKHPSTGNRWQQRPLTSGADVEAWYEDHPHDNVGILTGPQSGIFVFDVDGATGIRSVTDLATERGALPATRIVRTGSGGLHYFFRHPGHFTIRNSTSWIAPGIDIRGEGGQVVAPPSTSGRGTYEVIADHPLADPPAWLLELLREHADHVEHGRTARVTGAEPVDVAVMPEKVRTAASTLVGVDEGRYKQFHHIVAACREAGYTQGQAVTIAAPWCAAVDKYVGRVEAETARCWAKLDDAAAKANEWLPGVADIPTRPETDGTAALAPAQPDPAADTGTQPQPDPSPLDLPPSWAPVDLEPILTGTYQPETPSLFPRTDDQHLVYPARVHSFHGESESGKSLVVQAEAARLLGAGRDVLYIDFESDAAAVVGRLLDLGATPDQIRDHLDYIRPDNDPRKFAHEREHYAALLGHRYTLAVIDGMTDALGTFGAGSTDNDEIADFMRNFPRRIAQRTGAAVIIVDHVTKDADSRGRWALGGQAKMNALDGAAYVVEVAEALGRGLVGAITLRVAKDRPGGVRPHCGTFRKLDRTQEAARIVVDSTGEHIKVTTTAPHSTVDADPRAAKTFRPTGLMQKVSDFLERAGGEVSQNVVLDGVSGKDVSIKQALAVLVAEGNVSLENGPRNARIHKLITPYFADEDPDSDTYTGWVPEAETTTVAHLGPDRGPEVVSDRGPTPSPPTGRATVSGGGGGSENDDLGPRPRPANPEASCNGCGKDFPASHIVKYRGYCANCSWRRA